MYTDQWDIGGVEARGPSGAATGQVQQPEVQDAEYARLRQVFNKTDSLEALQLQRKQIEAFIADRRAAGEDVRDLELKLSQLGFFERLVQARQQQQQLRLQPPLQGSQGGVGSQQRQSQVRPARGMQQSFLTASKSKCNTLACFVASCMCLIEMMR
jgi:hypothetical protein